MKADSEGIEKRDAGPGIDEGSRSALGLGTRLSQRPSYRERSAMRFAFWAYRSASAALIT